MFKVLLRKAIQKHYVSRSVQRSTTAAERGETENVSDKAPLFYFPGSMSETAAGKLKKKKEERPKMF